MKRILLFSLLSFLMTTIAYSQYYYNAPPVTTGGNPGGLNGNYEEPYGNGLAPGWTDIQPSTHPGWSSAQNIPFNFVFNGNTVSQYRASTYGLVTFSPNPQTFNGYHNLLPSSDVPDNTICIWGLKYTGPNSNDKIVTKTFGVAPNRQHWIMFNSYNNESNGQKCWTYWSIVLEETSNRIYVVDQRNTTSSSCQSSYTIGLQYNSTSALMVNGSPNIYPLAGTSKTPYDNKYYEFIPGQRPNYDITINLLQMNPYLTAGSPVEVRGTFKTYGAATVTSYDVNYQIDNNPVKTMSVSGANISMNSTEWYIHDSLWTPSVGSYDLKVWCSNINGNPDQNPFNDTLFKKVEVLGIFVPRIAMHEIFFSSDCIDCKDANDSLKMVLDSNLGSYTRISYPIHSDPYKTAESQARATFYGVDSIPEMVVNGLYVVTPKYYTNILFNEFMKPAYLSITPTIYKTGNTLNISASILPFPEWTDPGDQMTIRVALIEKLTLNNVGTNGETKFYNVFHKMIGGMNGTPVSTFTPSFHVNINESYTLTSNSNIENIQALAVIVFVQNDVTKEIYQSGYAELSAGIGDNSQNSIIKVYPNPISNYLNIDYYNSSNDNVEVEIYSNTGQLVHKRLQSNTMSGMNQMGVNLSGLSDGIYLLKLKIGNNVYSEKFVINK